MTYTGNRFGFYIHGWGPTHGCIAPESGKWAEFKNTIRPYFEGRATIPLYVSYGAATPTPTNTPAPTPTAGLDEQCSGCTEGDTCVGGIFELADVNELPQDAAGSSNGSSPLYAALASAAAAVIALVAAGGWYAHRRFRQRGI